MKKLKGLKYQKFSQENADFLCQEVQRMEETQAFVLADFVEAMRELAEVIIWSDKNMEPVYDSFLERNMMSTFERIVTNAGFPSAVKVQAIQCITMMLQNLTRKSSIYFVCSNNHLNRIISISLDEGDDELFSIYVSFLKTLALRLNEDTVQFFFERETGAFPLFDRAAKLLAAPDRMVRAAARQIVISVAHLSEPAITAFLERALNDVFDPIALLLWSQIKSLGEATEEYGNVGRDTANSPPLPSLSVLIDRMEDIVDDLFYVNDLFEIPHEFVPPTLEHVLDKVVLCPLFVSLEVPSAGSHSSGSCSSSRPPPSSLVPTSTALCILTRWLLLNKVDRLRRLFRERLMNSSVANNGLLRRVLTSGCMQSLSGGVVLLDAMLKSGFFEGENDVAGCALAADIFPSGVSAVATTDNSEGREALALGDLLGEIWDVDQLHDESFTPLAALTVPPCEAFVNRMFQCVVQTRAQEGCKCLVAALYHLITHSALASLAIIDLALHLLAGFARRTAEHAILLKGLLFLCLSVIRRRTITYAEYLASRNMNDGSSSTAAEVSVKSQWLRNPYEVLFVKLEQACSGFEPYMEKTREDLSKEVSLLLPVLPSLDYLRSEWEKGCGNVDKDRWKAALRNPEQYAALQKSFARMVPRRNRAAQNSSEEESTEFLIWMTVRHHLHTIFHEEDGLLLRLRDYGVRHRVGTFVSISPSVRMWFRCELVKEHFLSGGSPPT
ncbi:hypothetical protein DQ04_03701100, partial [Trypanosoma grayi]|uniref:hypothetical protein n=1 Tax=Trypanosoma grayi TaxID=71804 RepID=UPI0004F3FEFC